MVFLALAVTTGVFLKVGHRLVKIGLLTVASILMIAFTLAAIPLTFGVLSLILITLATVAFLFGPAVVRRRLDRRERSYELSPGEGEVISDWFTNAR